MRVKFGMSKEEIEALSKDEYVKRMAEVNFLRREEGRQLKEAVVDALAEVLEAL